MAADSQGSTFSFAGATLTVTNVTVSPGGDLIDFSHLGLASGANRVYQAPALRDNEISIEAYATAVVSIGSTGAISFASVTYSATVSSSSVTYSVGELIKQSISFKVQ